MSRNINVGMNLFNFNSHDYRLFVLGFRSTSLIIRSPIRHHNDNTAEYDTGLGDNDIKYDGIPFSLNKKERWSLPELIKTEILEGDHMDDSFGIQLVERHKIAKKANCISIYTTHAQPDGRQERTKKNGYLQVSNVLKRRRLYSRRAARDRCRRGLPVEDDAGDAHLHDTEPTQIRYEVLYPSPSNSALTRNPKTINYETKSYGWDFFLSRRRYNRHRKHVSKHMVREAFSILDEQVEDSEEEAYVSNDDEHFTARRPTHVTLEDILEQAKTLGTLVGLPVRQRRQSGDKQRRTTTTTAKTATTKDRVLKVQQEVEHIKATDTDIAVDGKVATHTKSITLDPVIVVLPFEEITPHALGEKFDDCYIECDCFPRKFVLDISQKVSAMEIFRRCSNTTVNAYLVFTVDGDNEMNTLTDSICKVVLNTSYSDKMGCVKIETVFDYMETKLDELICNTLFFIDTLPDDAFLKNVTALSYGHYKGKDGKQTHLEDIANWSTRSYTVNDVYLLKFFTRTSNEAEHLGYEVVSQYDVVMPNDCTDAYTEDGKFCGVCYELVGDENPATALQACRHWFCNRCWQEHLDTKIRNGSTTLPCPEYDCEKEVDAGTALSFLNMTTIIRFAKYCHDTEVERVAETRWCPNKRCGRVLRVSSMDVKIATCVCGEQFCVDCLGKSHWPADCDSVKVFQKRMAERGDTGILPVEAATGVIVNVKQCPHCKRYVEKYGGCPMMVCICKKSWCWGCGKDYYKTDHSHCRTDERRGDTFGTIQMNIAPEDKLSKLKRRKWYKLALVHRVGQHPVKFEKMKFSAKNLCTQMKELIVRSVRQGNPICLDFQMTGKSYRRECEKVPDFLNSLIDLYREVSQLVVSVAALLDSARTDKDKINRTLQYIVNRLAYFVNIIYDLFTCTNKRDVMDTLLRMKLVRQHAKNAIHALYACVQREKI